QSHSLLIAHPWHADRSPLSLHDALPICYRREAGALALRAANAGDPAMIYALAMAHAEGSDGRHRPFLAQTLPPDAGRALVWFRRDRKSTRLNSSHVKISYAVFCLKKKIR